MQPKNTLGQVKANRRNRSQFPVPSSQFPVPSSQFPETASRVAGGNDLTLANSVREPSTTSPLFTIHGATTPRRYANLKTIDTNVVIATS